MKQYKKPSTPEVWDRRSPNEATLLLQPAQHEDPVEHRLHCQISDCAQCRCDSGYVMPVKSSEKIFDHRSGGSSQHCRRREDVNKCFKDIPPSPASSSLPPPPPPRLFDYEYCQYCGRTLNCSIHSNYITSVSSSHVCSCTCKSVNLQPATVTERKCSYPRLSTTIQRFISRFSGRLRRPQRRRLLKSSSLHGWERMTSFLYTILTVATFCLSFLPISDACSSRSTPKPRPPSPTLRPNITIQTYTCPPEYDAHYCLNGATCFTVKIGESILYNCECAEGYMGQRCEFKDLDGSYLRQLGALISGHQIGDADSMSMNTASPTTTTTTTDTFTTPPTTTTTPTPTTTYSTNSLHNIDSLVGSDFGIMKLKVLSKLSRLRRYVTISQSTTNHDPSSALPANNRLFASKQRAMLEQAGLTSGAAIIVVIVVIVCFYLYVRSRRKFEISQRLSRDVPDGLEYMEYENERRPFSGYYYHNPSLSHNHQNSFHSPTTTYHHPQQEQQRHQQLPEYHPGSPHHTPEQEQVPSSPISDNNLHHKQLEL